MCLAIPSRVVEIKNNNQAIVEVSGVRKETSIALVNDVKVGDYVILHMGYALEKLDETEAQKTLEAINGALIFPDKDEVNEVY